MGKLFRESHTGPHSQMPEPSFYGSGRPADGQTNAAPQFAKNAHLSPSAAVFQPGGGAGLNAPGVGMQNEFVPQQLVSGQTSLGVAFMLSPGLPITYSSRNA